MTTSKIIYTKTDEAPALATYSLLPIVKAFANAADIEVETRDISLAGRIISQFPERLTEQQRQSDDLAELGEICNTPEANIIKLPNISASIPQLQAAIKELQKHGYNLPDYPANPSNEEEQDIKSRYANVLGSAVNPVLRIGNSDRRVAAPVKEYAKAHPHSMGDWDSNSKSHVSHMDADDFYGNEQSVVIEEPVDVNIELVQADGSITVLKEKIALEEAEILDSTKMSGKALQAFFEKEIEDAKAKDVLFSLHVKATMMKVSDPIMFGYCVKAFYKDVFEKHADTLAELNVDPNNGIGDLYSKIANLPNDKKAEIEADIEKVYQQQPELAMVDSDKGITNLHVPSDVIIDASMPAAIRASGQMWGPDGKQKDTKFTIPDRCYAGVYEETIDFCKKNGAFDPSTMGSVSNVGLMGMKAEEYGSHDKTFLIPTDGTVRVVDAYGNVLMKHNVEAGDIFRACQVKDWPTRDWVKLAVNRARATGDPAVFWLDENRAHDANLIKKVNEYLKYHDTDGLEILFMPPVEATRHALQRVKEGKNTISVTGNVLRDYLTDLFPILELGTSAKMLSIVPLLSGGAMFETGAGGSAPKHVQQFNQENHLRWDSLGEFLALAVSLEDLAGKNNNSKAAVIAAQLNKANSQILQNDKSPLRKVGQLDNRGSHFYLAMYWAQAIAEQTEDAELATKFAPLAKALSENEQKILDELNTVQGQAVDIGGYYQPDDELASKAMRPSETFNTALATL